MTCDAIAKVLAACLGYMPAQGQTVVIPKVCERRVVHVRLKAIACAAMHGVQWRIARDR